MVLELKFHRICLRVGIIIKITLRNVWKYQRQPETENRRTDNTMAKGKSTKNDLKNTCIILTEKNFI
jgi:hypothetical protein